MTTEELQRLVDEVQVGTVVDLAYELIAARRVVEAIIPFAALADIAEDDFGHGPGSTCEWRIGFDDTNEARAALSAYEEAKG